MRRYLKLYRSFVINSLSRAMEFRAQFFAGIVSYLIWSGVSLLFIEVVFGKVGPVAGWSRHEMWVLYGSFLVLESLCYGVLGPNMWRFSTMVRDGSLDLALTRPVNTQFLVSLRYLDPNGVLNALVGLALVGAGLWKVEHWPSLAAWLLWLALLACGFVMAYAIWFLCVTISIWAIKLEGISVVFDPLMQVARFPLQIYPQRMQWVLLTILPAAFLTTFPAQALLGRASAAVLLPALALAAFLLFCSHRFFNFALKYYGSASS
jgi:ABC-2 type transport system permease protein